MPDYVPEKSVTFIDASGADLSQSFVDAVERGAQSALKQGCLIGGEVRNVKVTLLEAQFVDSPTAESSLEAAAQLATHEAMKQAAPVILEPIMKVQISTPETYLGTILGDLGKRRGVIKNIEVRGKEGKTHVIYANVPLSELFKYTTILRTLAQGRANESMELLEYSPMPRKLQKAFLEKHG